ncbi:hypothetical protein [Thalassobaculum salexigens]|uniref:hypothetical protein n=1 Tax=Thalassobaculum salexigens TaxID=455360 RepID=UPI000419C018|nr:hypothetical protein [Thalassobaculum salexigens]
MIVRLLFLLFALVVLAGCGQLPQPFSKDEANLAKAPFLIAPATEGVLVWPMVGVPDDTAELITEMTVDALQKRGVAASSNASNRSSLMLSTSGERQADGALKIIWTLSRPNGEIVGTRVDAIASDPRFEQAVTQVARWIVPNARRMDIEPPPFSVTVYEVGGAPGNGNDMLRRAMAFALKRADVAVADFPPPDGFVVQGYVSIEPKELGGDLVKISWTVMDGIGRELGTIDQSNTVASGALDTDWGPVASPIAKAAVPGIVTLIERHLELISSQ